MPVWQWMQSVLSLLFGVPSASLWQSLHAMFEWRPLAIGKRLSGCEPEAGFQAFVVWQSWQVVGNVSCPGYGLPS